MWNTLIVAAATLAFLNVAKAEPTDGFHNESEAGIVLVDGNSQTSSYNFAQQNGYGWSANLLKFNAKLLKAKSRGLETSRFWTLGLRYERELNKGFSLFTGYTIESDVFAGYDPRHNADLGLKYFFLKAEAVTWSAESGYRFTREHRNVTNIDVTNHFARLYTEVEKNWNKTASTKFWFEYLPNFTTFNAYRINSELSASAAFTSVLSTKLGYLVRYNNTPSVPGGYRADRIFTAALVAKF